MADHSLPSRPDLDQLKTVMESTVDAIKGDEVPILVDWVREVQD